MGFGSGMSSQAPGGAYHVEVNKKDLNVGKFTERLNQMAANGWRLHTAFEQSGNTVVIYERVT